jgi:hypothetical protein
MGDIWSALTEGSGQSGQVQSLLANRSLSVDVVVERVATAVRPHELTMVDQDARAAA